MALFQRTQSAGLTTSFRESLRLGGAAIRAMAVTISNRRAAGRIAEMPDYLLSDIGLKRDDVHDALNQDWRCDPTYMLAMKAADRTCKGKMS